MTMGVEKYLPMVRRIAASLAARNAGVEADDLEQEAMLAICQSRQSIEGAKDDSAYAGTVARNAMIRCLAASGGDMQSSDCDQHARPRAWRTESEFLKRKLSCLPDLERQILTLMYGLDGGGERPVRDVGALLRLNPSVVHRLRLSAVRRLRKLFSAAA